MAGKGWRGEGRERKGAGGGKWRGKGRERVISVLLFLHFEPWLSVLLLISALIECDTTNHMRGHTLKLRKGRTSRVRHHFFTERVINIWNKLGQETIEASSVNVFKGRLQKLHHKDESFFGQYLSYWLQRPSQPPGPWGGLNWWVSDEYMDILVTKSLRNVSTAGVQCVLVTRPDSVHSDFGTL